MIDRNETKPCELCCNQMPVWKQQLRHEKRKAPGAMRWYRTGPFCCSKCAAQDKRLSDAIDSQRASETKPCAYCLSPMPVWKRTRRGTWKPRGPFCSKSCSRQAAWNDPSYRQAVITGQEKHVENRRERLITWNKSDEGRRRTQHRSKAHPATRTEAVAEFANVAAAALQKGVTGKELTSRFFVKIDGRLLGQGGPKKRGRRVIRLFDQRVFDSTGHVAKEIGRSGQTVSECIQTGHFCKGYQYMFEADWLAHGRPQVHPSGKDRRVVRISDGFVFASVEHAAITIDGESKRIYDSISKVCRYGQEFFMRYSDWVAAGKPTEHPRQHMWRDGRSSRRILERDEQGRVVSTTSGQKVIRLTDGVIFSGANEAAKQTGGTANGIRNSCRTGRSYRGHCYAVSGERAV